MSFEGRVSYYQDKYGIFYRMLQNQHRALPQRSVLFPDTVLKPSSTWLRLIMMFWNTRVMKTALRFGVAAVVMNQYERLGLIVLILCFVMWYMRKVDMEIIEHLVLMV